MARKTSINDNTAHLGFEAKLWLAPAAPGSSGGMAGFVVADCSMSPGEE